MRLFLRIIVWSIGVLLCLFYCSFFVWAEGPPHHQWFIVPVSWKAFAILAAGCPLILITTNAIDRTIRKPKKKFKLGYY